MKKGWFPALRRCTALTSLTVAAKIISREVNQAGLVRIPRDW
jgi:hypothetical protein